jgi:hypothetical protein
MKLTFISFIEGIPKQSEMVYCFPAALICAKVPADLLSLAFFDLLAFGVLGIKQTQTLCVIRSALTLSYISSPFTVAFVSSVQMSTDLFQDRP